VIEGAVGGIENERGCEPEVFVEEKVAERRWGVEVETQNGPTPGVVNEAEVPGFVPTVSRPSASFSEAEASGAAQDVSRSLASMSEAKVTGDAQALTRPSASVSEAESPDNAQALTRLAGTGFRGPELSAWIREHYSDERLAEMMARYRAKFTEERIREGCDQGPFDPSEVWPEQGAGPPGGPSFAPDTQ
jgi:hypothetical protein